MAKSIERMMAKADTLIAGIEPLIQRFDSMSTTFVQSLKKADQSNDKEFIVKAMQKLDIDRPLLVGKTILRQFTSARDQLFDLRDTIDTDEADNVVKAVRPHVDHAIKAIEAALREHVTSIKAITKLQDDTKSFVRRVLALAVGVVKDAVSLFIGGPTSFIAKTTQVMAGVQGTSRHLTGFVQDARKAVKRAESELQKVRGAVQKAVK